MSNDAEKVLFEAHRTGQDKYTYFLLAGAGAAIGFAVTRTSDAVMSWSQVPLALAVVAWGLSFFFGCRQIAYVQSVLYSNSELIRVNEGRHPMAGNHPEAMAIGRESLSKALDRHNNRASLFARWQFYMLVAGGVLYVLWHALEMYLRSRSKARLSRQLGVPLTESGRERKLGRMVGRSVGLVVAAVLLFVLAKLIGA